MFHNLFKKKSLAEQIAALINKKNKLQQEIENHSNNTFKYDGIDGYKSLKDINQKKIKDIDKKLAELQIKLDEREDAQNHKKYHK